MKSVFVHLVPSAAPRAAILIRLMVGGVFLPEGIQKFLEPAVRGAGRFAKIGIPWPEVSGPFVGVLEITCGALLLAGLATRFAAIPLVATMVVAGGMGRSNRFKPHPPVPPHEAQRDRLPAPDPHRDPPDP